MATPAKRADAGKAQHAADIRESMKLYSPNMVQRTGKTNLTDCIDAAFTLHEMGCGVGKDEVVVWLTGHLTAISGFSGARRTLSDQQLVVLAEIFYNEYGWLNAKELMVFFYRLKLGNYGMFYGSFDPGVVMRSVRTFLTERMAAVRLVEDERTKAEMRAESKKCVSYEEYKRMLAAGELDHLMTPEDRIFFGRPQ